MSGIPSAPQIDKRILSVLNNVFDIQRKISGTDAESKISRNLEKIISSFSSGNEEFFIENPLGEKYTETRTDIEAHIVGDSTDDLTVVDVIKPIIRYGNKQLGLTSLVQRGIVTVESTKN